MKKNKKGRKKDEKESFKRWSWFGRKGKKRIKNKNERVRRKIEWKNLFGSFFTVNLSDGVYGVKHSKERT